MLANHKYHDKTDEQLVELTLKDQECYLYLMQRYEDKLIRYILRISDVSREAAEDVLQEVFIKCFRNLNSFDTSLKFSSWIYRITRNEAISHYRKRSSRPKEVELTEDKEGIDNIVSGLEIEASLDREILAKEISKILINLDQKYREVLVLRFLEDRDYQEISDILKKPMGTVATLIRRAKERFRKEAQSQNIKFTTAQME